MGNLSVLKEEQNKICLKLKIRPNPFTLSEYFNLLHFIRWSVVIVKHLTFGHLIGSFRSKYYFLMALCLCSCCHNKLTYSTVLYIHRVFKNKEYCSQSLYIHKCTEMCWVFSYVKMFTVWEPRTYVILWKWRMSCTTTSGVLKCPVPYILFLYIAVEGEICFVCKAYLTRYPTNIFKEFEKFSEEIEPCFFILYLVRVNVRVCVDFGGSPRDCDSRNTDTFRP